MVLSTKVEQPDSPALLALELVGRPEDVTESSSGFEIQERLGLRGGE